MAPPAHEDYSIAWICALPVEVAAATAMLDEIHETPPPKPINDPNAYTLGKLNGHLVVIACLPNGIYGTVSAATVMSHLYSTFPHIQFALMVGIGGGVPSKENDIRLGDVVVSKPTGQHSGVIQYDYGKAVQGGHFENTGKLNSPPLNLLTRINQLEADQMKKTDDAISIIVQNALERNPDMKRMFTPPNQDTDYLFFSSYHHHDKQDNCAKCDKTQMVYRQPRYTREPQIHYGLIASGDQVMKDSETRDRLAKQLGIICFEMEAAGLMNQLPTLVIRGVCDYCDSHKQKRWQAYSALSAAAYAKKLLKGVSVYTRGKSNDKKVSSRVNHRCLEALQYADPSIVKNQLKEDKDSLLPEAMNWIFQNPDYCLWQNEDKVRLLWIKGGAGKGKTMMSIGLIDNFLEYDSSITTYFFCKFTDYKLNTLKAIITSLIWQLVQNQAELLNSLLNHWDPVKSRYKESFSWRALWNIFLEMLAQCRHQKVYVVVDALDECENDGMAEFLTLIVRTGLGYSNVKWLLTSRPLNSADESLLKTTQQLGVSFELNSDYLKTAIKTYVQHKVNELYPRHKYGVQRPQRVESELLNKAEGTFLWVSIVCKRLESERIPLERALKTIMDMPPGLQPLYKRVFSQVVSGDAATIKRSLLLLKVMMLAYRPLAMNELANVMGTSEAEVRCEWIVDRCASFIKMRGSVVEFVHQSSRDFLARPDLFSSCDRYEYGDIFSFYEQYGDGDVALTCLNSMRVSTGFNKNLISLPLPNSTREVTTAEMGTSNDKEPILNSMKYAAMFWAEHLKQAKDNWLTQNALRMQKEVREFLREKLLEWLECLSLLGQLPRAIRAFKALERICEGDYFPNNRLWKRRRLLLQSYVLDANRFLMRHKQTMSAWPLQIYSSTIVFSPKKSQIRSNDRHMEKIDKWLKLIPHFETNWNSSYQTLEGHTSDVEDVAFSSDGKYLASASRDQTIRLWDTATGSLQTTLEGHPGSCSMSVIFFGDHLVSASHNRTIHLWDMNPKNPQEMKFQKIKLPSIPYPEHRFKSMAFSADGKYLATIGSTGSTMETSGLLWLWNINTDDLQKSCLKTTLHPKIPGGALKLAFSPDNKFLALVSQEYAIWLLNLGTDYLHKIDIQEINRTDKIFICQSLEFSPNGEYLAAAYHNKIGLWNISTGDPQKTLIGHKSSVEHVTFSSNDKYLASTSCDRKIKLWDVGTGDLKKTFEGLRTARFSPDTKCIASVSGNFTVRLWDIDLDNHQEIAEDSYMHTDLVTSVIFSPDGKYFASASSDCSVKLWDANNGNFLRTLQGHTKKILNVAFSPDGKYIASASYDGTVQLWCVDRGILKATSTDHISAVEDVIFSPDSKCLASTSHDWTIQLWTIESGQKKTLRGHEHTVSSAAFSLNGKYIASASQDFTIKLWDANTGNHLKTLRGHNHIVLSVAFSSDSKCIASSGCDKTIRLWDVNACLQSTGRLESNFYEWHRYFRTSEKSDNVKKMKFSVGDEFIQTNLSPFQVNGTGYNCGLYLRNGWIWYGLVSVLRIPPDLETSCYDVQGNRLIIGSKKGLVLFFEFDREKLDQLSELRYGR